MLSLLFNRLPRSGLIFIGSASLFLSCAFDPGGTTRGERMLALSLVPVPELEVVSSVDATQYAGRWYQQAAFPQPFNQGCDFCTIADYGVESEGVLSVYNQCNSGAVNGDLRAISGTAYAVPGTNQAVFGVEFFPFIRGPYYIIALADDYRYAMVGDPYRVSLFILSRTQVMATADRQLLEARAQELGFETSRLIETTHAGCTY